ncbi:MAG: MFS transporter [Coriobacteriales bacterium]|nr:MFS transporter [Coriobacteriales bacterium]
MSLATFGLDLPFTPFSSMTLDGPTAADSNGTHTAIVDSASRRLFILNKDHKLTGIVNCSSPNSPLESFLDVCVSGDTIYVSGVCYKKNTDVVESVRVVAYDARGASEKIVYDRQAEGVDVLPSIKTMAAGTGRSNEDGCYVVLTRDAYEAEGIRTHINLQFASREASYAVDEMTTNLPQVFDVGYSAEQDEYCTLSERGILSDTYSEDETNEFNSTYAFTSLDLSDSDKLYLYDDISRGVYCFDSNADLTLILSGDGYGAIHSTGTYLTLCNQEGDFVSIKDESETEFTKVDQLIYSTSLSVWVTIVFVSRAYIMLFIAALLLLMIRKRLKQKNYEGIGPLFASIVVVGVVALAIAYTSYGTYEAMRKTRANEINAYADYFALSSSKMSDEVESCKSRDVFRESSSSYIDTLINLYETTSTVSFLARSATQNGIETYTAIYAKDDRGIYYIHDSTGGHVLGTGGITSASKSAIEKIFSENTASSEIAEGKLLSDITQYRLVRIPSTDGKSTVGVIEVGSHMLTFEASFAREQFQRTIALLVVVLVVYLTYVELRSCARCFVSFHRMKHHHDAIAILTRPFSFVITLLSSIDAVMTTLIARSMLSATGDAASAVLPALPSVMLGIGLVVGQAAYALLGSRTLLRTLMKRGAVLMAVAAIFTGLVVLSGNFWLYCFAKLTMAIPFGLLYTLSYSLPRRADSDEVRALAASGIKRTDTSAAALGTVLGGYVAENLGNAWVYALVALVSAVAYIMAAKLFPRTKHPMEKESKRTDTEREALRVLLMKKSTLATIFFIMMPATLASGYNSFVFPLYSAHLGVETSAINNLFVLGQLVVFVCISTIEYLEARYDKWRVSGVSIALLGAVFLLFSLNTSFVWAVVTIALVGVLCKASDGWKALWVRSANAHGVAAGLATGEMFAVRSVLLVVRPLLLGFLLNVGDRALVIVLGVLSTLCAAAFFRFTRHSSIAPEE